MGDGSLVPYSGLIRKRELKVLRHDDVYESLRGVLER